MGRYSLVSWLALCFSLVALLLTVTRLPFLPIDPTLEVERILGRDLLKRYEREYVQALSLAVQQRIQKEMRSHEQRLQAAVRAGRQEDFALLPTNKKNEIYELLLLDRDWGTSEFKPVYRDIIDRQTSYPYSAAFIEMAAAMGWTDLNETIANVYARPRNFDCFERAFFALRSLNGHPVPEDVGDALATLREAGFYRSKVTDEEVARAAGVLRDCPDKEVVLACGLSAAIANTGKGGTDRGHDAALQVLKTLPGEVVAERVRALGKSMAGDSDEQYVETIAEALDIPLNKPAE